MADIFLWGGGGGGGAYGNSEVEYKEFGLYQTAQEGIVKSGSTFLQFGLKI